MLIITAVTVDRWLSACLNSLQKASKSLGAGHTALCGPPGRRTTPMPVAQRIPTERSNRVMPTIFWHARLDTLDAHPAK